MGHMVYLALYTNKVKAYCDKRFFYNVEQICKRGGITKGLVIDNSYKETYAPELKQMTEFPVYRIIVTPGEYQFQRNVAESLMVLRQGFLKTKCEYFFILETDIIPPVNIVGHFMSYWKDYPEAGILGAHYYKGFHSFTNVIEKTHHVLSGCTMYRREVIEKYPFRIDLEANAGAFPDAWISYDLSRAKERGENNYEMYNIPVICEHVGKHGSKYRGQEELYL